MSRAGTRLRAVVVAVAVVLAAGAGPVAAAPVPGQPAAAAGRVLVRFSPTTSRAARSEARAAARSRLEHAFGLVKGLELLRTDLPVAKAIERLRDTAGVEYAEPDYLIHADLTPDDPLLPAQWGIDQPTDADIDATAAWDTTTGDPGVVVAVVDSGMQLDHPDLAANLWTNPGEVPGNGIDDDDDGYVDDVHGWDFVADDNDPADEHGHGTHVAGTIAAVGDNGVGVVGVAWHSRLMPLRVLDGTGTGTVSAGVAAIDYAWRHGVRISNHSWTSDGASQTLIDAVQAAGAGGQLVVAAAGNKGVDIDPMPAYPAGIDLPNVISVAAVTSADGLALFSNYGPLTVDIGAPGVGIVSTWTAGGYASLDGTSMAAPHVSGVAALLLAAHPTWTVAQVRDRILSTARPVSDLRGLVASGGMVNAAAALAPAPDLAPSISVTAPAPGSSFLRGTSVAFAATASDPEDGDLTASLRWVSDLQGPIGTGGSFSRANLVPGTHVISVLASDAAGHHPLAAFRLTIGAETGEIVPGRTFGSLAIAAAGGAPVVAWSEPGVGTAVARRTAQGWTSEVASPAYVDHQPDLGFAPGGDLHLLVSRGWQNVGVYDDAGILSLTGDGSGWTATRISDACGDPTDGCGEDWGASWAIDGEGRSHAAWLRVDGNVPGIYSGAEHANGAWTASRIAAIDGGASVPDVTVGPDGATWIAWSRTDPGHQGVYVATDGTGSWSVSRIDTTADANAVRVAVAASGRVDVAWASGAGVAVRSRVSGAWGDPVVVSASPGADLDLARDGTTLHLVYGLLDAAGSASGIAYATADDDGPWSVTNLATGQARGPRLAVDEAHAVHVAYEAAWPSVELRYATNGSGSWTEEVVARGMSWADPAFATDSHGVHHVAVARGGTDPGVYYGTDAGGSWSLERVTTDPPDGTVGLAIVADGTGAAIVYAERLHADGTPVANPGVFVARASPGGWSTTRIGPDDGTDRHGIARDPAGRLHVVFSRRVSGASRIAYATNASGSWTTTTISTGSSDRDPAIALDGAGRVHVTWARGGTTSPIWYATNRSGSWARSQVTQTGGVSVLDWRPAIAVDLSGHPRIAFTRAGSGVRLLLFDGARWASRTISSNRDDMLPSVAVDATGRTHVLYARTSLLYSVCAIPLCPAYPGLRYASGIAATDPFTPVRLTDMGDDTTPAIVGGADGSIAGGFAGAGLALHAIRLQRPVATVSAPVVHLAGSGTLPQGRVTLVVTFKGSQATTYRLQQSVNGRAYETVGSVGPATSRTRTVKPSDTKTRRFRVTPYDGAGQAGPTAYGATFRVWTRGEVSASVRYTGTWRIARAASFVDGAARHTRSSGARAMFSFRGREVAWIAARGPGRGSARVYVDGRYAATVSLEASSRAYRQVAFRKAFGGSGSHTVTIRPIGDGLVDLDGFIVLR